MTPRPLGRSGLSIAPLVLGGNVFGWSADEARSFEVLDAFADAGLTLIDTADAYSAWVPGNAGGESETIIGRWMASRGNRDQVVIATKVGSHPGFKGLKAATIKAGVEQSLRRLQTDRIDLYYTHFDDPATPVEEFIGALDELVREGKVRRIGASNISPERLAEALEFSRREGLASYVALQQHYNLVERSYEEKYRALAEREDLGVMPYFALAAGFLTGKYRDGITVESARAAGAAKYLDETGRSVLAALDDVAAAHGVSVATIALAWLAAQPTVTAPIASARTLEQLPDLLASVTVELTAGELAALDGASEAAKAA